MKEIKTFKEWLKEKSDYWTYFREIYPTIKENEEKLEQINEALKNHTFKKVVYESGQEQYLILVRYQDRVFLSNVKDRNPQENQLTKIVMLENIRERILEYERDADSEKELAKKYAY